MNASVNLPADVVGFRLTELGANVTKVEPPTGDPVWGASPEFYRMLTRNQEISKLDLKHDSGREAFDALVRDADLLVTSSRPSTLERLGLGRGAIETMYPHLMHVAIVGHPAPNSEIAGHDLTYIARHGLVDPPALPRTLAADLHGAERATTAAIALLLSRERNQRDRFTEVALDDSAAFLALPRQHGLTSKGGSLGGGSPWYGLYETRDGWIALAALEGRFQETIVSELSLESVSVPSLAALFRTRTTEEWEGWAKEHDVPLAAVIDPQVEGASVEEDGKLR